MSKDFTEFDLMNPEIPKGIDGLWNWQVDCNWIILKKLKALADGQERVTRLWTWAKVSLGMCSGISVVLGVLFLWKRILS